MDDDAASETLTTVDARGHGRGARTTRIETAAGEFDVGPDGSPLEHLPGSLAACVNVVADGPAGSATLTVDGERA